MTKKNYRQNQDYKPLKSGTKAPSHGKKAPSTITIRIDTKLIRSFNNWHKESRLSKNAMINIALNSELVRMGYFNE